MRLNHPIPACDRARIDAQSAAAQRAQDLAGARRLAATAAGRLLLADAIDEAREEARYARREAFAFTA